MTRLTRALFLLSMLLSLVATGTVPQVHSTSYVPGVKAGDFAKYSVTTYWTSNIPGEPVPPPIAQLQGVSDMTVTVLSVTADIVTAINVVTFNNNTQPRTLHLLGSVLDGSGNLTTSIIAAGLSSGDKLYTSPTAPTINNTSVGSFAGALRSVNVFNFSYALGTIYDFFAIQWERYSGLSVDSTFSITGNVDVGPYHYTARGLAEIKMTQTSITHDPPDFSMTGGLLRALTAGTKGNLTLTLHSENGFAGNVILTASTTPSGALVSVQPGQVNVPVDGQANATVVLSSNSTGNYLVTITATGGSLSHTKTDTFNVNAAPVQPASFLGLQPVQLYALIGIAAAVLVAVSALALSRSRRHEPITEAPPSSPPPPPATEQPTGPAPQPTNETS